jgi:hypothetical protein
MIKIRVLNKDKKDVMVLVNPACIVTVEQAGEDHYKVYLSDGRILNMTEERNKSLVYLMEELYE